MTHFSLLIRPDNGPEDAINCISHLVNSHFEDTQAYACLLFIDFSSVFNILQPGILISKLIEFKVNPFCICHEPGSYSGLWCGG